MKTKVARWGNSLALRIPKRLADAHRISEGSDLEITENEGEIRIRPIQPKKYQLSELLKNVATGNIHREHLTEEPRGREVW